MKNQINIAQQQLDAIARILVRTRHQLYRDNEKIKVVSGRLKGLKLRYESERCLTISSYGAWISIDSPEQFSWRNLLRLLIVHRFVS